MTQNNITDIEKCARLMGCEKVGDIGFIKIESDGSRGAWFNPLTNKSHLMDLECAIGIDITWLMTGATASNYDDGAFQVDSYFADHHDKFTARAHAVIAVAVQIYDRREE